MSNLKPEHRDILETLKSMAARGELHGMFSDIPIEVYHHPEAPGISSTTVKRVIEKSANHLDGTKDVFRFGNAFHAFAHEPEVFQETYKIGHNISTDEIRQLKAMTTNLMAHPEVAPLYIDCAFELTFFAIDPGTGVLMKCRADGYQKSTGIVWDLKSTRDACEYSFTHDAKKYLYRVSAAYYLNIISLVRGWPHRDFRLIACEKSEPYGVAMYSVDERSLSKGEEEIRIALNKLTNPAAFKGYESKTIII